MENSHASLHTNSDMLDPFAEHPQISNRQAITKNESRFERDEIQSNSYREKLPNTENRKKAAEEVKLMAESEMKKKYSISIDRF